MTWRTPKNLKCWCGRPAAPGDARCDGHRYYSAVWHRKEGHQR
jgi:hypothetical protein